MYIPLSALLRRNSRASILLHPFKACARMAWHRPCFGLLPALCSANFSTSPWGLAGYLLPASAWCSAMLLCAAESVPAPILHVVVAVQISSASGSSGSSVFFPQQPKVSTSPACA